ncbi:MAG: DMT family transporter [Anaerolineales bacterium]
MRIQSRLSSKSRIIADFSLLMAALLWGSSFAAQRAAALSGGVYFYNGVRFLLGAFLLLPLYGYTKPNLKQTSRSTWLWGVMAGLFLFLGSSFQQVGLQFTTAANAGFITGLYVVIIPFILAFVYHRSPRNIIWVGSFVSIFGMFLLSTGGKLALSKGDGWELIGAFIWAGHVLVIDRVTHHLDLSILAILQSATCGILSLSLGIFYEHATFSNLSGIWWAVIWTAVASIALGFTLQAFGQKVAPAADAAIILCLESVFAAIFGWVMLKESLTLIQIIGALLMFSAMIMVQVSHIKNDSYKIEEMNKSNEII